MIKSSQRPLQQLLFNNELFQIKYLNKDLNMGTCYTVARTKGPEKNELIGILN